MTLIGTVRKHAIQYGKQLPDFLCVERIRRYYQQNDPKITSPGWRIIDSIAAQVTYIDGHENYRAIRLNNKPAPAAALSDLRGTVSQGEFGTMLQDIFRLESEARFAEGRPAKLRGRRALVFTYDIEQENSRYRLTVDNNLAYVPAYRGQIFIDDATKTVMRLTLTPYAIPGGFPLKSATTTLDYGLVMIGGKEYVLPVRAEILSNHYSFSTWNVIEFLDYRKFGADSKLIFDTPDPAQKRP